MTASIGRIPRLASVSKTASELGVCDKTVRRLIARGALAAVRVGSRWRISEAEILAYLARETTVRRPVSNVVHNGQV